MSAVPLIDFQASVAPPSMHHFSIWDVAPKESLETIFGKREEDRIIASTSLKDLSCRSLVTYLRRRFGPPLAEGTHRIWVLTTPEPDVEIFILPFLDRNKVSFSIGIDVVRPPRSPGPIPHEEQVRIADAYRALLIDLLRPVRGDKGFITALGKVGTPAEPASASA
jgi:hypothetical protein